MSCPIAIVTSGPLINATLLVNGFLVGVRQRPAHDAGFVARQFGEEQPHRKGCDFVACTQEKGNTRSKEQEFRCQHNTQVRADTGIIGLLIATVKLIDTLLHLDQGPIAPTGCSRLVLFLLQRNLELRCCASVYQQGGTASLLCSSCRLICTKTLSH